MMTRLPPPPQSPRPAPSAPCHTATTLELASARMTDVLDAVQGSKELVASGMALIWINGKTTLRVPRRIQARHRTTLSGGYWREYYVVTGSISAMLCHPCLTLTHK
jgi:hypothetical protein